MRRRRHKRKVSRIVLVTSDSTDAKVRQIKIRPWLNGLLTLLICVMLGAIIGYAVYEEQIWAFDRHKDEERENAILALEGERAALEAEISSLQEQITLLSDTVTAKDQAAGELQETLAQQSVPTGYPLTGNAGFQEITEGEPIAIFTISEDDDKEKNKDIMVVASAKGTVMAIEEDETYGNRVTIDHGNGYYSIYRNAGDVQVRVGNEVSQGTTLFLIGENNRQLGYQIMYQDEYINPLDLMATQG